MKRAIVSLLALVLLGRIAAADTKIKNAHFIDAKEPAHNALEVIVGGASPGLRKQDFSVKLVDAATGIAAERSTPFSESQDDLAVVVLVQGSQRFLGLGDDSPGYWEVVKQALDTLGHARAQHTRMALFVYGNSVIEKVAMGTPDRVNGDALGPREDYASHTSKAFQRGLEEAARVLAAEKGRRVLFIIGDGDDERSDYNPRLELDRLNGALIEVYALGASPDEPLWSGRRRLEQLGKLGAARYANKKEELPQVAAFLVGEMNSVYTVVFPDFQTSDGARLPLDGGDHEFSVRAGTQETDSETLRFPGPYACVAGVDYKCMCPGKPPKLGPPCDPPAPPLWPWLVGAGAVMVAGAGTAVVLRRRGGGEDDGADELDPAPAPPPPPPLPMPVPMFEAPRHTVAISKFVDDDSFPIVGWIVPLNGAAAFQTFRLADGKTIIGAADGCDVRIDDPHMSRQHAEILLHEGNFVLMDNGSRNGVMFEQKRVTRHTLIDNDFFTCGSTTFKFKSTN